MDDGLAEKLYAAFWNHVVSYGWPKPCTWGGLHQTQRDAWEQVAIAARLDAQQKINAEIEMLRGANDAWQREYAELESRMRGDMSAAAEERVRGGAP